MALDHLLNGFFLFGSGDETLSGRVGRGAIKGNWLALRVEPVINWLMDSPTHCRDSIGS